MLRIRTITKCRVTSLHNVFIDNVCKCKGIRCSNSDLFIKGGFLMNLAYSKFEGC